MLAIENQTKNATNEALNLIYKFHLSTQNTSFGQATTRNLTFDQSKCLIKKINMTLKKFSILTK